MRPRTLIVSTLIAAAFTTTACVNSDHSTPQTLPAVPATKTDTPVQPTDTTKNKYVVGPFTLTMIQGIAIEPNGHTTGSEVLVENTSNDFTGFANPEVQYTLNNEVVGTSNGTTWSLAPGQKQTLWINVVADRDVRGQFVDAQLTSIWFGADRAKPGTQLQLAH